MNEDWLAKGGEFWEKSFLARISRPLLSSDLSETVSTLEHCAFSRCGGGSIPGTFVKQPHRILHKVEKIFSIISQLIVKVLKVLGNPRRRGVPANPAPLLDPPPLSSLLIHPWSGVLHAASIFGLY